MLAHEQLMACGWDSASTSSDGSGCAQSPGAIRRSQVQHQQRNQYVVANCYTYCLADPGRDADAATGHQQLHAPL